MPAPARLHPELPWRPPRAQTTVFAPSELDRTAMIDWSSWYLTDEEDVGQSPEHGDIVQLLYAALVYLVSERRWPRCYLGVDAFFAWVEQEPLVRISPDVYLVFDPPDPLPKSFQVWRDGHNPPAVAVEIVSDDWRKDYELIPQKYDLLGTRELIVFDPEAARGKAKGDDRHALQLFVRKGDGLFVRTHAWSKPVWSKVLMAAFVVVDTDTGPKLRLSWDELGEDIIPTRVEAEAERADKQAQRADAAEAELDKLRAELALLRDS